MKFDYTDVLLLKGYWVMIRQEFCPPVRLTADFQATVHVCLTGGVGKAALDWDQRLSKKATA